MSSDFDGLDPDLEARIAAGEELAADEEQLARYVRAVLSRERKIAEANTWAKGEIARIEGDWLPAVIRQPEQDLGFLRRSIAIIMAKIEERQGKRITQYPLPTGTVRFRLPPESLEITDEDALLLAVGTDDRFADALTQIPASVSVDKGALKRLLRQHDATLPGVTWTRGEQKMTIEPPKRSPADPETYGREENAEE